MLEVVAKTSRLSDAEDEHPDPEQREVHHRIGGPALVDQEAREADGEDQR